MIDCIDTTIIVPLCELQLSLFACLPIFLPDVGLFPSGLLVPSSSGVN